VGGPACGCVAWGGGREWGEDERISGHICIKPKLQEAQITKAGLRLQHDASPDPLTRTHLTRSTSLAPTSLAHCKHPPPSQQVVEDRPAWRCEFYPPAAAESLVGLLLGQLLPRVGYIPQPEVGFVGSGLGSSESGSPGGAITWWDRETAGGSTAPSGDESVGSPGAYRVPQQHVCSTLSAQHPQP